MTPIFSKSLGRGARNEDFSLVLDLPERLRFMIVGDFASTTWDDIGALAEGELRKVFTDKALLGVDVTNMLASAIMQFNNSLLNYKDSFDKSFQCCAAFAAMKDAILYYFVVGDCRIVIRRGGALNLLNGSVWGEPNGFPAPAVITNQELRRQREVPPSMVLGVDPVELRPGEIQVYGLEPDDEVVLYSDGVDKAVSPRRILEILSTAADRRNAQSLGEAILTEVDINHGDDDRTVVVAVGPHTSKDDALDALVQEQRKNEEENLKATRKRLAAIELQQARLEVTSDSLAEIRRMLVGISTTQEKLITKRTEAASLGRNTVTRAEVAELKKALVDVAELKKTLVDVARDVGSIKSSIKTTLEAKAVKAPNTTGEVSDPEAAQPVQPASPVKSDHSPEAEVKPPSDNTGLTLLDPSADALFREGILHLKQGGIDLIDEVEASRDIPDSDILMSVPPDRPSGWLTASYLILRARFWREPQGTYAPYEMREWISKVPINILDNVPAEKLKELKKWHWTIRNRRRKALWPRQHESLTKEEYEKALAFFDEVSGTTAVRPKGSIENNQTGSGIWSAINKRAGLVLIGVFVIIAIVIAIWWFWPRQQENRTQPPSNDAARVVWTIKYGGNGRTIFLLDGGKPEPTGFKIQYGEEQKVKDRFKPGFPDRASANKAISDAVNDSLIIPTGNNLKLARNVGAYLVDGSDVNCAGFLRRVNSMIHNPVHNESADLEKLNPELRCAELRVGEELLVFIMAPKEPIE